MDKILNPGWGILSCGRVQALVLSEIARPIFEDGALFIANRAVLFFFRTEERGVGEFVYVLDVKSRVVVKVGHAVG